MNMAQNLIEQIYSANGVIETNNGKLRISAPRPLQEDLIDDLRRYKEEILDELHGPEIMSRAALFRDHLSRPGPIPFFTLPGAPTRDGFCMSCGEQPPVGRLAVRCQTCETAAHIALADYPQNSKAD